MDGLLAIIETILVLSLTYIALATAASALSGTALRLFRLRSRGLRSMVEYIYRNHLIPLIERLDREYVDLGLGKTGPFAGDIAHHRADARPDGLCQFIVDLTFLPQISKGTGAPDPRVEKVKHDDWFSLASSQESLTLDEFQQRLAESAIGQRIAETLKIALNKPQDIEVEFDRIAKQFDAQQNGATNWFTRVARNWSIVFGFVIAIGLNVDSVDLFGAYLGDPSLRRDVLERQERILSDAEKATVSSDPTLTGTATNAEAALAKATEKTTSLKRTLETVRDSELVASLADTEGGQQIKQLLMSAGTLADEANRTLAEAQDYVEEVRNTAATLTAQFPIGWNRFPSCEQAGADPRCVLRKKGDGTIGKQWRDLSLSERLGALPGEHLKWLFGMLVTGFLLGLGAPFWVEVFNNMLRARKLITDLRSK